MRECRGRTTCGNNASDSGAIARLRPDALQLEAASLERRRLDNHRIPNNSIGSDPAQTGPQRDTSQAHWHREVVEMGVACERLVTAIHEGDRHGAERAAQGIRVLSGAIGAVRLQELTCRVNAADRRGEGTPLEEIGTKVLVEVERVLRSLAPGLQWSAGVAGMA